MSAQRLHYTTCGLDGVYLADGFEYSDTPDGRRLHVFDREGLHRAIGAFLVRQRRGLTGKEIRFLRVGLGLSRATLARWLGESDQSVARREKRGRPSDRPSTQERVIRFIYERRILDGGEDLATFLEAISEAEDVEAEEVSFEKGEGDVWRKASAA